MASTNMDEDTAQEWFETVDQWASLAPQRREGALGNTLVTTDPWASLADRIDYERWLDQHFPTHYTIKDTK